MQAMMTDTASFNYVYRVVRQAARQAAGGGAWIQVLLALLVIIVVIVLLLGQELKVGMAP
jgi:hypothetical protein